MQIASILSPDENVAYVVNKFRDQLPMSVESFVDSAPFNKAMDGFANKRGPDAFGFMEYITSKDMQKNAICMLKAKGTKKKPLSFERLNIMVMAIFKYFESQVQQNEKKADKPRMKTCLAAWLDVIQAQSTISINQQFEAMLNIYLVLSVATSMKADAFLVMTRFLCKHGQLKQVMIKQVQDLPNLSDDWQLSKEERYSLYVECARLLMSDGDSTYAFKLFHEAAKLVNTKGGSVTPAQNLETATGLIVAAIKSPEILNFEEIVALTVVQELKSKAKQLYDLVAVFTEQDMGTFKKTLGTQSATLKSNDISQDEAMLKKQYIQACTLTPGQVLAADDLAKLLGINADDIDEWIVDASLNGVLEAQIDQGNQQVTIKTTTLRKVDDAQWHQIKDQIDTWKSRFTRIQTILQHQPETKE